MGFFDRFKKSSNSKNFKYLDKLIHSGEKEIILDSDIALSDDEESEYLEGIKLDVDNLTIDGNGFSIDAKRKARIFFCSGKNITVKNIALNNGFTEESGGAICNAYGELNIEECEFNDNTATLDGGAIYNFNITTEMIVQYNLDVDSENMVYGKLKISNTLFNNNVAQNQGGAIQNFGEMIIDKSSFNTNVAKLGGAIFDKSESKEITITKSSFIKNLADRGGGISCTSYSKLNIKDCKLKKNIAKYGGGAIHNYWGKLTITGTTLTENSANDGGAIDNDGELTIYESIIAQNMVQDEKFGKGGAIVNMGKLRLHDSTISQNIAKGGITVETLENNLGITGTGEQIQKSGVIQNIGDSKIFNCEFLNNESTNSIIVNEKYLEIHNTILSDNFSELIIFNYSNNANLGIFNTKFIKNNVLKSVIFNDGKFCSLENTLIEDNSFENIMDIINKSNLTLNNLKINCEGKTILNEDYILIKNECNAILKHVCGIGTVDCENDLIPFGETYDFGYLDNKIHGNSSKTIVLDTDISLEKYEWDYYEGGIELDIDELVIDGNGHTIDGAGKSRIFIITADNIVLKNITFKNGFSHKNYANEMNSDGGGALKLNYNTSTTIKNCRFIKNTSETYGGAIRNNGKSNITESVFERNYAGWEGGAIINHDELTIVETMLSENTARDGGAIYNQEGELDIAESILSMNKAQFGGAIRNSTRCKLTITETIFRSNTATIRDGAIANNGKSNITESVFERNNADGEGGGAIGNTYGELTITNSNLTENSVQKNGGAIFLKESEKYESENCTFKDNKPDDIYEAE